MVSTRTGARRTDRDYVVSGRHSRAYYKHADRWLRSEVAAFRLAEADPAGRPRSGPRPRRPGWRSWRRPTARGHAGSRRRDDRGASTPWPPTTTGSSPRSRLGRRCSAQAVWRRLDDGFGPGDRVLELGCGTGEDAVHLAQRGVRVRGHRPGPGHGGHGAPRRSRAAGVAGLIGDGGPGHRRAARAGSGLPPGPPGGRAAVRRRALELRRPQLRGRPPRRGARPGRPASRPGGRARPLRHGPRRSPGSGPGSWPGRASRARAFRRLRRGGVGWRGIRGPLPVDRGPPPRVRALASRRRRVSALGALVPPTYAEGWAAAIRGCWPPWPAGSAASRRCRRFPGWPTTTWSSWNGGRRDDARSRSASEPGRGRRAGAPAARRSDRAAADPDPLSPQPLQLPLSDVRHLAGTGARGAVQARTWRLAARVARAGRRRVVLTGGEALLHSRPLGALRAAARGGHRHHAALHRPPAARGTPPTSGPLLRRRDRQPGRPAAGPRRASATWRGPTRSSPRAVAAVRAAERHGRASPAAAPCSRRTSASSRATVLAAAASWGSTTSAFWPPTSRSEAFNRPGGWDAGAGGRGGARRRATCRPGRRARRAWSASTPPTSRRASSPRARTSCGAGFSCGIFTALLGQRRFRPGRCNAPWVSSRDRSRRHGAPLLLPAAPSGTCATPASLDAVREQARGRASGAGLDMARDRDLPPVCLHAALREDRPHEPASSASSSTTRRPCLLTMPLALAGRGLPPRPGALRGRDRRRPAGARSGEAAVLAALERRRLPGRDRPDRRPDRATRSRISRAAKARRVPTCRSSGAAGTRRCSAASAWTSRAST